MGSSAPKGKEKDDIFDGFEDDKEEDDENQKENQKRNSQTLNENVNNNKEQNNQNENNPETKKRKSKISNIETKNNENQNENNPETKKRKSKISNIEINNNENQNENIPETKKRKSKISNVNIEINNEENKNVNEQGAKKRQSKISNANIEINNNENQNEIIKENEENNNNENIINQENNNINNLDNENKQEEISNPSLTRKKIQNLKRINPDDVDDIKPKTKEDRNTQKLLDVLQNDDYDQDNPEYHEYMFFPIKGDQKPQNIEPLLKKTKKKKKTYTYAKNNDNKKDLDLAKILHINYDVKKPKFPYSIQKLKVDKPAQNDYLVIEYNLNKMPKEKQEDYKRYEMISRVVHTNYKGIELDNYDYTKNNGERYDYLEMNNDTNQVRRLKLMKEKGIKVFLGEENEDEEDKSDDEEKRIKEKEENEDRFNNKYKKGKFTIKKMI